MLTDEDKRAINHIVRNATMRHAADYGLLLLLLFIILLNTCSRS